MLRRKLETNVQVRIGYEIREVSRFWSELREFGQVCRMMIGLE